jgi:hypothetical protein
MTGFVMLNLFQHLKGYKCLNILEILKQVQDDRFCHAEFISASLRLRLHESKILKQVQDDTRDEASSG